MHLNIEKGIYCKHVLELISEKHNRKILADQIKEKREEV